MSFTRDWSESNPIDHSKFKTTPESVRNVRIDLSERLKYLFYGFIAGETDVAMKKAVLKAQADTPTLAAGQVALYAKTVSGKAELHMVNEDATETVLSSAGKLKAETLGGVYPAANVAAVASIMALVYPVGSYYFNDSVATNPGTLLGVGTWVAVEERVLVGYKSGSAEFGTAGGEYGAKTHTLITSETPAHTHTVPTSLGAGSTAKCWESVGLAHDTQETSSVGGGGAHNNCQPSRTVFMWRRTA